MGAAALIASDVATFAIAVAASFALTRTPARFAAHPGVELGIWFALVSWIAAFSRIGMYRRSYSVSARDEVYASLAASAIAMAPAIATFALLPVFWPVRHALVLALLLSAIGAGCSRLAMRVLGAKVHPNAARRIAVAGSPDRVAAIPEQLSLTKEDVVLRLPVEAFDHDLDRSLLEGGVGHLEWVRRALAFDADTLIVTEALPPEIMPALLALTEDRGVKLAFAPTRIRPHACDFTVHRDGGLALIYPRTLKICTPGADVLRRVMDLLLVVPALVLLAPLLAAVAAAVALDSGRPVFFRQTRVGKDGREFQVLKFRTMRVDAEKHTGPVWAKAGQSPVTRLGGFLRRYSLDELPQLLNVLRGEMSVVGPRPERPFYVEQFRKMLPRYEERHLVRPGITGWAQIHMRRELDPSAIGEKLANDLFYLEHWSIFLDVTIVLKTAAEFLFHRAA